MSEEVVDATPAAASPSRPAAVSSPCLMVYPLPSIADETFLYTMFKHKVGRSLFGGFAKGRFAILELTSKAMLNSIVKLIKERDEQVKRLADAAVSTERASPAALATDAVANVAVEGAEQKLGSWLEDVKVDEMTLADLFMSTTTTANSNNKTAKDAASEGAEEADVFNASNNSVEYLLNLSWRGLYPIFVVVSPVTIDEMYTCGGLVPEKKAAPAGAHGKGPRKPFAPGGAKGRTVAGDHGASAEEVGGGHANGEASAPPVTAAAAPQFPKDCCQKCGSPNHFTRKCDGSGPGPSPTAAATTTTSAASAAARAEPQTAPSAEKRPREEPVKSFPKDCCQKCGSKDHFTRHCDGSGPTADKKEAPTAPPPPPPPAAAAPQAPAEKKPRKEVTAAPAPIPVPETSKAAPAPTFVRTSKDQCKFCGSESHLSRHCPNK